MEIAVKTLITMAFTSILTLITGFIWVSYWEGMKSFWKL